MDLIGITTVMTVIGCIPLVTTTVGHIRQRARESTGILATVEIIAGGTRWKIKTNANIRYTSAGGLVATAQHPPTLLGTPCEQILGT